MVRKSKEQLAPAWLDTVGKQTTGKPMEPGRGREIPDPNPLSIPAGFRKPETLASQIARLVKRQKMEDDDQVDETWEDALDFDIDDDFDPTSPWETVYDPDLGREVSQAEYAAALPRMKEELEARLRNHARAFEFDKALQDREEALKRGEGVSPSPSSESVPSPAEPHTARKGPSQ